MNLEEVTSKLGLIHWDTFEQDNKIVSGKTTKIICQSLVALSEGKLVGLHSKSGAMTMQMWQKAMGWAEKLGLDASKIRPVYNKDSLRGTDILLFEDHHY